MALNKDICVLYARVSSREQEETGYSLDAQLELLREHAERCGLRVAKVFRVQESASKYQVRKTLNEMLEYCEKHGVSHVLCEKIDRLTRSMKDATIVDEWVREKSGRQVHFVKESFVLSDATKAHENFVWDMKVATARFYTNNLSEEVRKGQKEKIRQGWLPTKPPLGYKTIGDKGHKIHMPDEAVAPLLKKGFAWYASGTYSLTALGQKLYDEGLRTRGGYRLSRARLHEILKDPFYYGAMRWNDVVYENAAHEPLVTKEIFDAVQAVMSGRKTPHSKRKQFAFSKLMKCGECGGTISGELHKGHVYYYCKHNATCSQRSGTREEQIEKMLVGVFRFFEGLNSGEADAIYKKIRDDHAAETEYKKATLQTLEKRYSALQGRLEILYDDRLAGTITQERWLAKQKEINDEQQQIRESVERIKSEETKYYELYINVLDLARRASDIYAKCSPEQRRMLLAAIFSNLTLKDKNIAYTLRKPVAVLAARVQKQLDAEKNLERQKDGSTKRKKGGSDPYTTTLLRG